MLWTFMNRKKDNQTTVNAYGKISFKILKKGVANGLKRG